MYIDVKSQVAHSHIQSEAPSLFTTQYYYYKPLAVSGGYMITFDATLYAM